MSRITYDVCTTIDGTSIFTVVTSRIGDMAYLVSEKIVKTEDEQIRNALIKLGWRPPENENNNDRVSDFTHCGSVSKKTKES